MTLISDTTLICIEENIINIPNFNLYIKILYISYIFSTHINKF